MFLRPRRFGKSAFLNTLPCYYDIHRAEYFNQMFGPLYIGQNPTPSKNSHLVLVFDLSSIDSSRLPESFNYYIDGELKGFIGKYGKELGYPKWKS